MIADTVSTYYFSLFLLLAISLDAISGKSVCSVQFSFPCLSLAPEQPVKQEEMAALDVDRSQSDFLQNASGGQEQVFLILFRFLRSPVGCPTNAWCFSEVHTL